MVSVRKKCLFCQVKYARNSEFRELYDIAECQWNEDKTKDSLMLAVCNYKSSLGMSECNKLNMFTTFKSGESLADHCRLCKGILFEHEETTCSNCVINMARN